MESCVQLGSINIAHAFAASQCRTFTDFLFSTAFRQGSPVQRVDLLPNLDFLRAGDESTTLSISVMDLRKHEELRELGSFLRFLRGLPTSLGTSCTTLSLLNIDFDSLEELDALCDGIASPLCSLTNLDLDFSLEDSQLEQEEITMENAQEQENNKIGAQDRLIKGALLKNTSLQSVSLFSGSIHSDSLYTALARRPPCAIKELQVLLQDNHTLDHVHRILAGLSQNAIALTSLHIRGGDWSRSSTSLKDGERQLATMLETNTSLSALKLQLLYLPGKVIEILFASLEKNLHLTHLSLEGCEGPEWPSASSILDSLRTNGRISRLDLKHTPLETGQRQAAIMAQLERNQENLKQLKVIKSRGSARVKSTTVRLFLCGLPFSGKTTLSTSLVKWNNALSSGKASGSLVKWNSTKSAFSSITRCLSCARDVHVETTHGRTRGIAVSTLENDKVKVSLWDMAGQAEYYAFHDHMFPNVSNESTPSLFLFVWNPIQMIEETGMEIKDGNGKIMIKTLEMFEHEFRYWLRFIASKTLKSLKFMPKVLVAVTRVDLLQVNIKSWFKNAFNRCEKDFKKYIQFDTEWVFEMDARDHCKVQALALTIFACAASVLNSMPLVFQACEQARRVLARLVLTQPIAPLITKKEFSFLCKKHLGIDTKEMEEAVALSLNDSGDIIYFKSLELVVIDTQWFCRQIMGELLHFDDKRYQHQGFYTLEFLESLLESKINTQTNDNRSKSNKYGRAKETYVPKIEGKALVKLFMWTICRYGLAKETYVPKIEGKALVKLFMWTICRYGLAKETYVPKIEGKALVKLLIGLRLACQRDDHLEDSDVFIPASLCAVSRVHTPPSLYMKDDEGSTLTFMGRRLKCKNSICTFFTPGIFPLLQVTFNSIFCGIETILQENMIAFSHAGIKVLIEFFKHEGQDHFIDILIRSRLDLDDTIGWVHGELINNIEKVCAEPKGIQGVELVREVIRPRCVKETVSMDKRKNSAVSLQKLRDTLNYHIERKGPRLDCLSVFHDWQMTHDSDRVVDLLGREETIKVVEAYRRTFIAEVEDVLGINIEKEDCGSKGPDQKVFHSTPSGKERAYIYNGVKEACRGIQEMHKDIREMQKDIKRIGEDMQRQCQSLLPKLSQRMHELLTFFNEREMARLPRMFVVTKDNGGRIRKIVGAMLPSLENVRLELLCEHRSQPHLVEEQRGLSFVTLEDGLLKQGLPYIRLFLKIAGVVMKVGAHVAAGLGDAIPDFTRVLAAVANAPASSTSTQFQALSSPDHRSRLCFQKGQKWLQDVLLRYNCCTNETIHEKFGLSRVQYGDLHVGWLCDTHGAEGELYPI